MDEMTRNWDGMATTSAEERTPFLKTLIGLPAVYVLRFKGLREQPGKNNKQPKMFLDFDVVRSNHPMFPAGSQGTGSISAAFDESLFRALKAFFLAVYAYAKNDPRALELDRPGVWGQIVHAAMSAQNPFAGRIVKVTLTPSGKTFAGGDPIPNYQWEPADEGSEVPAVAPASAVHASQPVGQVIPHAPPGVPQGFGPPAAWQGPPQAHPHGIAAAPQGLPPLPGMPAQHGYVQPGMPAQHGYAQPQGMPLPGMPQQAPQGLPPLPGQAPANGLPPLPQQATRPLQPGDPLPAGFAWVGNQVARIGP